MTDEHAPHGANAPTPRAVGSGAKSQLVRRPARACLGCFILVLGIASGWAIVDVRREAHAVREAKAFCESLVPQLEAMRSTLGAYPRSLDALDLDDSKVPKMLRGTNWYHADDAGFSFIIWRQYESLWTTVLPEVYHYQSTVREWRGSTG
jgi:hypothetical protein